MLKQNFVQKSVLIYFQDMHIIYYKNIFILNCVIAGNIAHKYFLNIYAYIL